MNYMCKTLGALALLACVGSASAQTITIAPATANIAGGATSPTAIPVTFTAAATAPGNTIVGFQTRITYTPEDFTTVAVAAVGGATCTNPTPGIINVIFSTVDNSPAVTGVYCNLTFTVPAGVARTITLTHIIPPGGGCVNAAAATIPCTQSNGTINVVAGPTPPTVGPLAATSLNAGPINLTATGNVAVPIASAGVATASVALACTIPAGTNAFAITSGGTQTINAPAVVGPGTPIGVSCTRSAADVVATLTCTQTATPAAVLPNLTAAVTCPLGTVAAVPGSSPTAPGPIALIGAPGATATGGVTFTNVGGTAAYTVNNCTASPAGLGGYTTSTVFPLNIATGGTGAVSVSCVAPTASGTSGPTGTLACTTSAAGFNPTFNLTCTAQSASIPTLGNAGKALMVLLMLGFGLVGFQLYRRSA
jgi:hypothetical protein